jgi:hypothetical protein
VLADSRSPDLGLDLWPVLHFRLHAALRLAVSQADVGPVLGDQLSFAHVRPCVIGYLCPMV